VEIGNRDIPVIVAEAVRSLPLRQREVIVLSAYEVLPLEEVARIVECEVGAVKSRLHRARESQAEARSTEIEQFDNVKDNP
jgi:RNA polymerase sigma factor (sigma-70 family)